MSGVPFEVETDNRSNFVSDKSFRAFRKQRDHFYDLVREYEDKKTNSNFKIQNNLGIKITKLVREIKEFGTYKPFTRLFVSQMLLVCAGKQNQNPGNKTNLSVQRNAQHSGQSDSISSLMQDDPEKYRRLQSRFVTASAPVSRGKRVRDALEEKVYFYKEFVICADSYGINIHLLNELKERIRELELQHSQQILDDVLAESVNSISVSGNLSRLITSLRILGKFLGFLTFNPYNIVPCSSKMQDDSLYHYVSSSLLDASKNGHELLTVPWCTEYLKEANFSFEADHAKNICTILFSVFRTHSFDATSHLTSGDLLILLAVSKLFSHPVFNGDVFHEQISDSGILKFYPKTILFSLPNKESQTEQFPISTSFDQLCRPLVRFSLLYECHEVLKDIRSAVVVGNMGSLSNGSKAAPPQRKIKPSTEKITENSISNKKETQIQSALEEHFFRGQPSSLQRTVAFVAERCASNCVKHIRSVAMLNICDQGELRFRERINETSSTQGKLDKATLINQIVSEMKAIAHKEMALKASVFCLDSVQQCMKHLCSCETAYGVLRISTKLAKDKALASVTAWLATRLDEVVTMSLKARLTKVSSNVCATLEENLDVHFAFGPKTKQGIESTIKIDSLSTLFHIMKEFIVKLTFENQVSIDPFLSHEVSREDVMYVLHVSSLLLCDVIEENEQSLECCKKEDIASMRKLLKSSPHLKNSLCLTAKELSNRWTSLSLVNTL